METREEWAYVRQIGESRTIEETHIYNLAKNEFRDTIISRSRLKVGEPRNVDEMSRMKTITMTSTLGLPI